MSAHALRHNPLQRQMLAPNLRAQLKIAELPLTALSEYVHSEIDKNPLLKNNTDDFDKIIAEALASQNTNFRQSSRGLYSNHTVFADAEIRIQKGAFSVLLNDHGIPKLSINSLYRKILENPDSPSETKEFVKEQLKKALTLIDAIKKRRASLHKLILFIAETQKDFLIGKSRQMVPLTLSNLANKSNLHISTASRIVCQKNVLINGEIIPLKNLLSSPFRNEPSLSVKNVLYRLKKILNDPKSEKFLSDHKLSVQLHKEGIPIARRTVAKYRKTLGISSSFDRKNL